MNRTNIIFIALSIYIIAAFAWWTYAHIHDNKEIYEKEKNTLELLCYKATVDVNGAIQQEMFNDTNDVKKYFYANFPTLEIVLDSKTAFDFNSFLIRPKADSYDHIEKTLQRKIWMYTSEGVAMVLLLLWGIILIYRSLQNQLQLKRQRSNFLLSITHELKTPLTSIKLYLETLRKRKLDPEQTETILHNSLGDVLRLHDLVENLLLASQLDNHRYELVFKELNLSELVNETIDKFALPRDLHHHFVKNIEPGLKLIADENAIIMVLTNLLSNAMKYSPQQSTIEILLKGENDQVRLSVSNNGPSIPDNEKKNLFIKFYRLGDENTRRTKGTGVGLFIVKNLVNLHHAHIFVKDKHPHGTIFDIIFKKHA